MYFSFSFLNGKNNQTLKHLIPDFIAKKEKQNKRHGTFQAFTMFLDLSGFTNLTEHLFKEEGNEGAELMSEILNNIFSPLVDLVYEKGGFIPYYAGDAFTAVFPITEDSIAAEELANTGLKIQKVFSEKEEVINDKIFPIRLKIGMSFGTVEWGIVGKEHKGYYFRGPAIDNSANSEHLAEVGDVIVDQYFVEKCDDEDSHFTCVKLKEGFFKVIEAIPNPNLKLSPKEMLPMEHDDLEPFLPNNIIYYNNKGEFRETVSIFISFKNIEDPNIFDEFATIVREQFYNFSGYFKEIDFGDKGGVIVGFFGAPVTYGDNAERALEFILSLKQELSPVLKKYPLSYKIGVTSGIVFTGIIGGDKRCQYAAVGNTVNLAARLMVYADWDEVLVDKNIQKEKGFLFRDKGSIIYKGFDGSIPTYVFQGRNEQEQFYAGKMVGRDDELEQLYTLTSNVFDNNQFSIGVVFGEAGIGKSRLLYELHQKLKEDGFGHWYVGQADQILQKPFNPFIYLFKNVFKQSPEQSYEDNKASFEERFQAIIEQCEEVKGEKPEIQVVIKDLLRTQTVIAARLGLFYADSLWNQLDAKGRYQNTISAFINLLKAEAIINPYVLEIEDGHWFDNSTKALLSELILALQNYPVCLLITSRYHEEDGSKPIFFEKEVPTETPYSELDLNVLSPDAIESFAEAKLKGNITKDLKTLLVKTTNGNPFYTEQVLEYFSESGLLKEKEGVWNVKDKNVKISGSINAVLMARIDRLSSLVRETVKAAAVIGREFEVQVLNEVMLKQEEFVKRNGNAQLLLQEQIDTAEKSQIWKAVNELRYIFKHSLLREAVYDMQLRTRLRELHKYIAEAIENLYEEHIQERFADLAFHYEQANIKEKTAFYLEKAGDYSKDNFQNQRAIFYYDKLALHLKKYKNKAPYVKALLKKAKIQILIGNWADSEEIIKKALSLAKNADSPLLLARLNNEFGYLLTLKGNYNDAEKYLSTAIDQFKNIKDTYGMSKVYGNMGNVFFRQGEYEKAKEYFKESLHLGQQTDRVQNNYEIVSNLGLALMNQGNYEEAIATMQPNLEKIEQAGNKQGVANVSIFLGIVFFEKGDNDQAMLHYQKGLKECEDLDNKFMMAIALGCMGKLLVKKGHFDTATELFDRDLKICRELGDKQGTSIALGLLGDLYLEKGDIDQAIQYLKEHLRLSEELNYQKGIASALGSMGDAYFYKEDYNEARRVYKRGMRICEEIDNKRLLIMLLMRMTELLLKTNGNPNEVRKLTKKGDVIAEEIGNEELIFLTSIKRAQVELHHGDPEMAYIVLQHLLKKSQTDEEKGEVLFVLATSPHVSDREKFKQQSLEVYKKLYAITPKYIYSKRIKTLDAL